MKRLASSLTVTGLLATLVMHQALAESEIEASRRHLNINAVADMGYAKPYGYHDEHFWDIVRLGSAAVPDLLILVEDNSPTGLQVDLFGGEYRVGDIAVLALWKIYPDLPLVEFVDDPLDPRFAAMGFSVYWTHVRESLDNRRELQAEIRKWIAENETRLQWLAKPDHPAGGWYALEPPGQ